MALCTGPCTHSVTECTMAFRRSISCRDAENYKIPMGIMGKRRWEDEPERTLANPFTIHLGRCRRFDLLIEV